MTDLVDVLLRLSEELQGVGVLMHLADVLESPFGLQTIPLFGNCRPPIVHDLDLTLLECQALSPKACAD
jgi:hypothetical protein